MTSSQNVSSAAQLPAEIRELELAIQSLPYDGRAKLEPLIRRVVESALRRKRVLSLVQEALSQLRLDMKYLMFDLESTRRERDRYREQSDGHSE